MAEVALRDITKSFQRTEVLHGVSLDVASGDFVVILGPSGCGKSTLLRLIAGLETLTSGEIAIDGRVVNRLQPRERGCAMVFQNYALYPHMSVAENLGYALKVAGVRPAERRARVTDVAGILGLADLLDRKPGQLSGGQRQRVAMGRAIIRAPRVFLFDEPLSNLDAKLRVQMRLEVRQLHARLGATSLFVTHDQVEAMTLADRLVVMRDGVVEQVGPPDEVYREPQSVFVGDFLGSPPMNLLDGRLADAGATVVVPGAAPVELSAPVRDAAVGPVRVGIRPEQLAVVPAERGVWPVAVDFAEELGAGRLYHGRVGDQRVVVADYGEPTPVPADAGLALRAADLHLFAPDSGRRLATAAPTPATSAAG
jgi:sn-glycerol 3-phosphate transport system ATP-binding protein